MRLYDSSHDPAFPLMAMDIFCNALSHADNPAASIHYITEELRELTGAHCVGLLQNISQNQASDINAVTLTPAKYKNRIDSGALMALFAEALSMSEATIIQPSLPTEGGQALRRMGFNTSIAVPLRIGSIRVGSVLLLSLPDEPHVDCVLALLQPLSTVLALILRNAYLYEQQEKIIAQRTQQLEEASQALQITQFSVDIANEAIFRIAADGHITYANDAAHSLLGYSRDELTALRVFDINPKHQSEAWLRHWEEMHQRKSLSFETLLKTKQGRLIPVEITSSLVSFAKLEFICGYVRDISERKKSEEQLRLSNERLAQSQKMDSIGQLAGGIAHDFNNMLSGITTSAEILAKKLGEAHSLRKYTDIILSTASRASSLSQKLLTFSRTSTTQRTPLDLHKIIQDTVHIIEPSIDKRINIVCDLQAQPSYVEGNASELENALLNLALNARDAMPDGGTLSFSTKITTLGESDLPCTSDKMTPGEYLLLTVKDTGYGIPKEIQSKVFDPFFTTKEKGKGTGLGLSVVYGTVLEHSGSISLSSEIGQGASFTILLPLVKDILLQAETSEPAPCLPEGKTILLVEDEDLLRELGATVLKELGLNVIQARDGEDAVKIYQQHLTQIDVTLMDVVMPRMNGRDAFLAIQKINPKAKVVFSSGFTKECSINDLLESKKAAGFIQKPYKSDSLIKTLLKVFNQEETD